MAFEFSSVHNQGPQSRSMLVEHAVRCLTKDRSASCCVQRDYVKNRWDSLVKSCCDGETFSLEKIGCMENEVQQWQLFHDSLTRTRKASDLRVCYLGELNLLNDLELLIQNGILCRNVWVVVKDSKTLEKVSKSVSQSRFRNIRLREDDVFSFLKDFRKQFDIIYFDPCASLAEENTLKVIGYVFYYNMLTSPGALITTFSFPPLMGYPLKQPVKNYDFGCESSLELAHKNETEDNRRKMKENAGKEAKSPFEQYLKCRASQFDSTPLSERNDEENYGDYITCQVIDSATLFVPVERMLLSTPKPVWNEIFIDKGDFLDEILPKLEVIAKAKESGKSLGEQSQVPGEPSTLKTVQEQTAAEWHPQKMGALLKSAERSSSLCKTWIDEIFPDWRASSLQKYDISLLLSTPLMFSSHKFIEGFFNSDFRRTCLDPIECGKMDCLHGPCTGCLVANLLYGQLANPSFPVMNKLLRLKYSSEGNKVFSDVFIFDKCEYVYDQFPTVEGACHSISEPMPQMVYRMALDGLKKHLASVYASLFQFCGQMWSGDPCSTGDLLCAPKRQVLEGECEQSNDAAAHLDSLQKIESQLTKKVIKEPHMSSFGGQAKIDDTSLKDLNLSDCTGTEGLVPPAVRFRGSKSIAAYRRALKNGKTTVARVRIILIGATGAGKSSLLNALYRKFNMDAPLDEDGFFAYRKCVFKSGASELFVPLWKPSKRPAFLTSPWASILDEDEFMACHEFVLNCGASDFLVPSWNSSAFILSPWVPYLDENELMAWREIVCESGVPKFLVPSWQLTRFPTLPWASILVQEPFLRRFLSQNKVSLREFLFPVKERQPPSGTYMDWSTHHSKEMSATIDSEEHPFPFHYAFRSVTEKVLWHFSSLALDGELRPNFMRGEAIYVLVSDLSNAAGMESNLDHLVKWMNSVYSSKETCTENVSSSTHPPVILVGTHADKVVGDPLKPLNVILDRFRGEGLLQHVDETFFVNTCVTQEDVSISRLQQKLISLASTLPLSKQEIPLKWRKVETVLRCLAREGLGYLTLQHFKSLVKRLYHFKVEEDIHELLHFLCDCDAVTYYSTPFESDGLVFLDRQWLIHLLSSVSDKEGAINPTG